MFGIAVFSILLLLERVFDMANLILSKGVHITTILKLFFFIYPSILPFAIPMSILFGILFSFGRLSEDNEITAMKANSMSYQTMCLPIIIFAGLMSVGLIFFNTSISPAMQSRVTGVFQEILTQSPFVSFSEKSTLKLGEYTFYVNRINKKNNVLEGISIYKFDETPDDEEEMKATNEADSQHVNADLENFDNTNAQSHKKPPARNKQKTDQENTTWRISASSATLRVYTTGIQMKLYAGFWQKASAKDINNMVHMTFRTYTFFLPLVEQIKSANISLNETSSADLWRQMDEMKSEGEPYGKIAVEFWMRLLFATAPVVFVLLGLPLGIMSGKWGKTAGFALTIGIVALYYTLLVISMSSAEKNYGYAGFIMWLPNVFMLVCGTVLFKRMLKQ
jgi:lipopolysaccharide export system permease protein